MSEVGTLRGYHALVIDANNYLGMLKWFVNNSGSTSFLFIAFCAMIIVALLVGRDGRRRAAWMTLAYCFVITTVLLVASHLTNVWAAYRRFLFLQPLLFALVAAGVIQIVDGAKAWLRRHGRPLHPGADAALIVLCLVVVAALWAPAIQAHYADEKEDWRELSQMLLEEATPDDLIVNLAVGYQSERALRAYLGPDYGGLHIISPAIVVDSEDELALNEKMRIWMIYPIPLDVADATHRTLNDPEHLRTLDIPPRTYSPPFESLLALEGPTPAPATRDELRAWIVEGLERTALTDEPIFSGWRSNALNVLLTAYERAGDVAKVYEVYRQAPLLPGMAEDVKANMDDVAAYLEKRLTAADGVIAGSYWDDPMIRDAVAETLQSHGYMAAEELDRGALEQITRRLYDEWPGDDATRFEFEGDAWREQWESQLFLGEATTAPVPATGDDGTGETPSTCLLITTAGSGYRGAISREMKVEPGKLYLLGLVMQRESELGLQGKALYLTYPQGAGQRGAYASAWWGSAASEVFVALFAAPVGVEQITFSPVLIDNAGAVCLRSGFVASIAGDP